MSKFNTPETKAAVRGPVTSDAQATGTTYEGAPGYARDAKSELYLLGVTNFVSEESFYESAAKRDARFAALVHVVAVEDWAWLCRFLVWLRTVTHMRTAPMVGALEAARARLTAGLPGGRQLIAEVLQRADEPGEALAYWTSHYGRKLPKPVKRGIADAATRLYNERSLLKHDSPAHAYRFGDVIDLTHPKPRPDAPWQGALFSHALDRRHNRDEVLSERLPILGHRAELMALPVAQRREHMTTQVLYQAGMTWESLAGWLQGPMDATAWELVIPNMGYMALLRNLRNFDQAGVSDETAKGIAARLSNPEQVARSKQLPMRFLSAYRNAPSLRWGWALEQALNLSLRNITELPGRSLILVDRSGSMYWDKVSARSELTRADGAAIFGSALAMRCAKADLVQFGSVHQPVPFTQGESLLKVLDKFTDMGGTETAKAVRDNFKAHDRVVILTDEQAWGNYEGRNPLAQVPKDVPVYTWNLAGYQHGHGAEGPNRYTMGGLTDASFGIIGLLERGQNADWPF